VVVGGVFVDALPESDLAAKAGSNSLPPGQEIFYRITPQDLAEPSVLGEAMIGRFRTAPADNRTI
jgi:alkaline phosphatase D